MNLNSIKNFKKKSILLAAAFAMILTVFNLRTITAGASTVDVVVVEIIMLPMILKELPTILSITPLINTMTGIGWATL